MFFEETLESMDLIQDQILTKNQVRHLQLLNRIQIKSRGYVRRVLIL